MSTTTVKSADETIVNKLSKLVKIPLCIKALEPAKLLAKYFLYHQDASISQDVNNISKKYFRITGAAKNLTQELDEKIEELDGKSKELDGKDKLRKWLNVNFRIEMTDGRVLIGVFLCTDRDANVILGACSEYLKTADGETDEPRVLGLVMVPGRHIVSIQVDDTTPPQKYYYEE